MFIKLSDLRSAKVMKTTVCQISYEKNIFLSDFGLIVRRKRVITSNLFDENVEISREIEPGGENGGVKGIRDFEGSVFDLIVFYCCNNHSCFHYSKSNLRVTNI